jgi:hypothetical protein
MINYDKYANTPIFQLPDDQLDECLGILFKQAKKQAKKNGTYRKNVSDEEMEQFVKEEIASLTSLIPTRDHPLEIKRLTEYKETLEDINNKFFKKIPER